MKTPEEMAEERKKERLERFDRGYKKGLDAFDRANKVMPQWISVKERLPELGIHVLTYGIYTKDTIVAWRDDCDELLGMYDWVTEDRLLSQITHWMPLPAPPEDNK